MTQVLRGALPNGAGGGVVEPPSDLITDEQREAIRKAIDANIERLRIEGNLAAAPTAITAHPLFIWPLRMAPGIADPGYHGISNFVDLDSRSPDFLLDYNCGARTYDNSGGYNHQGSDIFLWPWSWRKMDSGEIQIVAAAPGQTVYKNDGNFDRSCVFNNNDWNAVYIQHADGSVAWYGHMKNGSPTSKQVGATVVAGEYLGTVGSSGNSTGPHLHLEIHDAAFNLIEPWFGPCNNLNPETWWISQRPYYDSAVERFTTGSSPPSFPSCPTDESPNARSAFPAGATIYFTTYYRDQLDTQTTTYTIYRPDGSMYTQWNGVSNAPYYSASYWWWSWAIPAAEPQGTWRFAVDYMSTHNERPFTIGSPAACGRVPETPAQGALLRFEKVVSQLKLTWGASCNLSDTDYVVYEGTLGNFTSHVPVRCTTNNVLSAIITPAAGSRYYLIGPRNATREGSLGLTSSGVERPVGATTCFPRFALQCP